MKVKDARIVLEAEEADKLIDHDEIARRAIELDRAVRYHLH